MNEKIKQLSAMKGQQKIVCLTAYTMPVARRLAPHVDIILVGDSVGMVLYGLDSTQQVTMDMMLDHGAAARRGAPDSFIVVDMPYGSYERFLSDAIGNARRLMQETGATALKVEGGAVMAETIKALVDQGIPVMAHIGLQPQSAPDEGGYKIKGRTEEGAKRLMDDALAVQKAGAFSVVIEGTIAQVAADITDALYIPTIGIGASPACDGQVLVTDDLLGMTAGHIPRFVKQYGNFGDQLSKAVEAFADDVRDGHFPEDQHLYQKKSA